MARLIGFQLLNGAANRDTAVTYVQQLCMVSAVRAAAIVDAGADIVAYSDILQSDSFDGSGLEVSFVSVEAGAYVISTTEMVLELPVWNNNALSSFRLLCTTCRSIPESYVYQWQTYERQGLIRFMVIPDSSDYDTVDEYTSNDFA